MPAHGVAGPRGATMVSMVTMVSLRRLISLLWRVLRYLGLGVLIALAPAWVPGLTPSM